MIKKAEAYWPLILLLALVKFVLPIFLQSSVYELQRDEFLYYQQGQHFDWGYLENPPLLSYLATISSWLGGSEAWIKFWPCLFGSATVVVSCLIAAELGGKRFAQFLAGAGIITGAFLRVHFLFQPNILDIFFWSLAVYAVIAYINSEKPGFIYLLCASLALGFLSKYSIVFIAASLVISLLISRHRKIFLEWKLWVGASLAFLVILQNLLWQYEHNLPLVHHMKELQETQLQFGSPLDFIKDQLLMLFPVIAVWIGGLVWLFRQKQWRFLAYTYVLVILLLVFGRGKSYYSLGIYPVLLASGAVAWEQWTQRKKWPRFAICLFMLILTLLFIPILLPVWKPEKLARFYQTSGAAKTGILKWEDQKEHSLPQDFADMLGWKELTQKTEQFFQSLPDTTKTTTFIYCRHYGQAGSLKYYGKDVLFKDKVISDNGSFLFWIDSSLKMEFKHLILVSRRMPDKDDEVFQHFQSVRVIDSVTNTYSRQYGDKIIFFENIDEEGAQLARDGLDKLKRTFYR